MTDQNLELQESGWEELRREARKIEGDLDVKLNSYAKLGARFTQGGYVDTGSPSVGSSRSWKSMEMEIQSLLEKLLDINDSMSRCAASATPATSVTQKLARHRDILHEFTQVYNLWLTSFMFFVLHSIVAKRSMNLNESSRNSLCSAEYYLSRLVNDI
ncbi:Golgi SNAP receptor complex member 1-2-like [Quercus suber]|uniref:Golgi SNAP receptor complex member 1-2-like n=1 Tax=Quercus suber TaxID=58331 RepID=UPI0032DF7FF9